MAVGLVEGQSAPTMVAIEEDPRRSSPPAIFPIVSEDDTTFLSICS